jgi:hypothetical protein
MVTNILQAISNISKSKDLNLENYKKFEDEKNRIQKQGAGLEVFIKDSFCGIPVGSTLKEKRIQNYRKEFSDTGHENNPPDAMIREGDAIEIKKIKDKTQKGSSGIIPLNSSPPKTILTNSDKNIQNETKECEKQPWERDYLYMIGNVKSGKLWRVTSCYGNCFVSSNREYDKIFESIKNAVDQAVIGSTKRVATNELGRIKEIDPQDFTTLRVRAMFELENPNKIFKNEIGWQSDEDLVISAIMQKKKFDSFTKKDRDSLEDFKIKNFKGKNPDSPKEEIDLVLIRYSR